MLDKHLDVLLADVPRRSVLFIDSSKVGDDGGCDLAQQPIDVQIAGYAH